MVEFALCCWKVALLQHTFMVTCRKMRGCSLIIKCMRATVFQSCRSSCELENSLAGRLFVDSTDIWDNSGHERWVGLQGGMFGRRSAEVLTAAYLLSICLLQPEYDSWLHILMPVPLISATIYLCYYNEAVSYWNLNQWGAVLHERLAEKKRRIRRKISDS
jgi:hypothetical protein